MTLRKRISLVAAVAVAIAIATAAGVCYMVVRGQLRGEIDDELRTQASAIQRGQFQSLNSRLPVIPASAGGPAPYYQFAAADGTPVRGGGGLALPVTETTKSIAAGRGSIALSDAFVAGQHLRVAAVQFPLAANLNGQVEPVAIQLARPLGPTDHLLSRLRLVLIILAAGGIGLAAALGRLAANRVLAPLAEVAETAEHVSETEDLSTRIHVRGEDEVGQLATRFNAMIERLQRSRAALDDSMAAQRQLVADASHELRTPVTSLRTNVEVLLAGDELDRESRDRLLSDVVEQTEELSALVGDLIEMARGDLPLSATEEVRLDKLVAETVARARRNAPGVRFALAAEPTIVDGVPERLARAVSNLLDNAARHSPPGGEIEVAVDSQGVRVRDYGGGIDEADLPFIFDRFYRGVNSRRRQGSGLGLAIVRQAAEQHGGHVSAANAPGGGALLTFAVPGRPLSASPGPGALTPEGSPSPVPGAR